MGLLDDAIREHLDLKRARGADPAEVERMEREALGPVRREPAIGARQFDAPEPYEVPEHIEPDHFEPDHFEPEHFEHGHFESERFEEPLTDLEALGYHDSTAPHPHPHREHAHQEHEQHPGLAAEHGLDDEHLRAEEQQPRRRFLRRSRPASLAEPQHPAHDEPQGAGPHTPREGGSVQEDHELTAPPAAAGPPPPPLEFNHPPKRPRFTAEPPTAPPPTQAAPAEHREPEPEPEPEPESAHPAAQPTTEFDVQQHLRDAPRHDEPAQQREPAQQHEPAQQDEDMLEETPEFLQDTPEHDRLWFEQRPPRDFDFDG